MKLKIKIDNSFKEPFKRNPKFASEIRRVHNLASKYSYDNKKDTTYSAMFQSRMNRNNTEGQQFLQELNPKDIAMVSSSKVKSSI